jgi:hypothetical protein
MFKKSLEEEVKLLIVLVAQWLAEWVLEDSFKIYPDKQIWPMAS